MHAHWVNILDGANDDGIVGFVADDFHLIFFPAEQTFIDQDLRHWRGGDAGTANLFILRAIISDAAACAAQRKGRANNGGQADMVEHIHRILQSGDAVIRAVFIFR